MSKALYRKYRSKSLDDIVGQRHITDILKKSIEKGSVAHAYLLTGPRGVGKTSIARILAHEINHLAYNEETPHLDIIEIDAASNNGVDDIRELRERVQLAPVSAHKKIYIIDEVHMLSKSAFNALLKTLEEPPEHVVFILATTNPDKLLDTIISRTQHFSFRAITVADSKAHLAYIAKQEKIIIDDGALELIAKRSDGSFRDAISLLDQLASLADSKEGITCDLVELSLGLASHSLVEQLLKAYHAKDLSKIVALLDDASNAGVAASMLASQLIDAARKQLVSEPQLAHLLDRLLDVPASSQPDVKLLTALAAVAPTPKPKSVALAVTTPILSAPLKDLQAQATKKKPKERPPQIDRTPTQIEPATHYLDWDKLIEYTRAHSVALYSVLSKCSYELQNSTLTLYTGSNFYKKKLDDVKYGGMLMTALVETGAANLVVNTVPTVCPPKDSTAAAVAVIMGGGEEVSVEA